MNNKRVPRILILLAFLLVFCFGSEGAFAAPESVNVKLPVIATGADCTAVLKDKSGNEVQRLLLKDGEVSDFEFVCSGVYDHDYVLELIDKDTSEVTYDKTVYNIKVHVYYDSSGRVAYVITANDIVLDGKQGKPDKLKFINIRSGSKVKVCKADPPVKKVIRGGDPLRKSVFDFVMKPLDKSYPMPEGSVNGIKTVHITGEGDNEFGFITFDKPGTYEYTAEEIDGGIEGYTYDKRIYTFRYVVTEEGDNLICRTTILVDGIEVDGITLATFVNHYKSTIIEKLTPKTGDDYVALILAAVAVVALVGLGVMIWFMFAKKKEKKKD